MEIVADRVLDQLIPVIGYLDDLVLVPLGLATVLRLMPAEVLEDCRLRAERSELPVSRVGAIFVVGVWLVAALWLALALRGLFA